MDRIKSAFEKAMERVEQLERPGEEQILEWKLVPEGRRLAADFLRGEGSPFAHLSSVSEPHRPYLIQGMSQVLISNLQLPRNEAPQRTNKQVLEGLDRLVEDRPAAKELIKRVRYVFDQYSQFGLPQREQAYQQLKLQVQQQVADALSRQVGTDTLGSGQVNVESIPEFQQHWLRLSGQLDQQYEQHLEEYRKQLLELL